MDKQALASAVAKLKGSRVCIIGDVMLDHYVLGTVERISPEAPVPVVQVNGEQRLLGGAGNVARNILALDGAPLLLGVRGRDPEGEVVETMLSEARIPARLVVDPQRPTTRKTRIIAHNQQVVRVDYEAGAAIAGVILDELLALAEEALQTHDVVILSDYGKGVLSQHFMDAFMRLVAGRKERPFILVDPKPSNYDLYKGVDILTPNTKEAGEGAGIPAKGREGVLKAGLALFRRLKCRQLLITLGAGGMALFMGPDRVMHIPTVARKVFDVTGAGDTVIATMGLCVAAGMNLPEASILANFAAGNVVGQVGAAVTSPEELRQAVETMPLPEVSLWLPGS